jgi:hypothetical protein
VEAALPRRRFYQCTDRVGRAVAPEREHADGAAEDALLRACDDLRIAGVGHEVRRDDGMILAICPKYSESRTYYARVKGNNRKIGLRAYAA